MVKNLFSFPWDAWTWPTASLGHLFRCWFTLWFQVSNDRDISFQFPYLTRGPCICGILGYWSSDLGSQQPGVVSRLLTVPLQAVEIVTWDAIFRVFFGLVRSGPEDEKMMKNKCSWKKETRSSCKGICILSSSSTTCKIYTVFWMNVAEIPT